MGRFQRVVAVAAFALLVAQPAAAAPKWLRLDSRSFVVVGATRESTLRDIASHLEQFRDVFGRVLPANRGLAALPTIVIVFPDERSYKPFWPEHEGKSNATAGVFVRGPDVNYVSVNAEYGEQVYRLVFHEYSHFITSNVLASPPLWLNEGLAEYNSTFEASQSGDRADLGRVIEEHLMRLRQVSLMPIAQLMAVDEKSPSYNEWSRQTVFYAQSWALVHYLALGNDARRGQLSTFIGRVAGGVPQAQAFREAFGCEPEQLDRELEAYLQQRTFRRIAVRLKEPIAIERIGTVTPISDREADAYLGDLLARMGRDQEARARLGALIKADATVARAHAALGLLNLREDQPDAAVPLLTQAVGLKEGDAGFQYGLGAALIRSAMAKGGSPDPATLAAARTALTRAIDLQPDFADAIAHLGLVDLAAGDVNQARNLFERARALVPSRMDYLFLMAQAHTQAGNIPAARALLTYLQSAGGSDRIRNAATSQLLVLTGVEKQMQAAAQAARTEASAATVDSRFATGVGAVAPNVAAANELNQVGAAAYDAGRYEDARDLLTRATGQDPASRWAWNNLGRALARLGRTDEAIAAYERQIAVSPRDEYAHGNLGAALWAARKPDAAEREFLTHLEIKPGDDWAVMQLARLQSALMRPADALATFEKATARPDARPVMFLRMASLALSLGAKQTAARAIEGALGRGPVPADYADAALLSVQSSLPGSRSQDYAAKAVSGALARMQEVKLSDAEPEYRPLVYALAIGWTAMGQLALDRKDLAASDAHLRAAWAVMPHPLTATVMGGVQSAKGSQAAALEWYALALAFDPGADVSISPLRQAVADSKRRADLISQAQARLAAVPAVPLPAPSPSAAGSLDVLVSIDGAGRIDAFHVLQRDQALADVGPPLVGLAVYTPIVGHEVARLIRQARVMCGPDGPCRMSLQPVVAPGDAPLFIR